MLSFSLRVVCVPCLLLLSLACTDGESNVPRDVEECPPGPTSPLGEPCAEEDQRCEYGYDPPECGGITVRCTDGTWTEESHTDPDPSCGADATGDAADADGDATDVGDGDADKGCPETRQDGEACDVEEQQCAYGYDPPECGGITLICEEGTWVEFMHTDPMPECFEDAGGG